MIVGKGKVEIGGSRGTFQVKQRAVTMVWHQVGVLLIGAGILLGSTLSVFPASAQGEEANARAVDFNRDIRPILSDKCFTCHGPDETTRMTKLRFDNKAGAFEDLGGYFAIVPGNPAASEVIRRITARDESHRMPPLYSGRKLTDDEIQLIRQWIKEGAKWAEHWSFLPPRRPALPKVGNTAWPRNGTDYFILERLESESLTPSREADQTMLLRRVSLDLTGLPPTLEEINAYLADTSPEAHEKVVDRLLASPRFGERMAAEWLDAARYADTNGYQTDGERFMWRWRDWVIDAFNRNMPFDQFTIEQLAGDMLPNATLDQKIATGFNRNHRGNGEGGIIPEEFAVEYVVDRVNTTSTVWLGLTVGCARCHDHKFDPVTQKEFYQLFAFFNNVPENGKALKHGNSPPLIKAPTRQQQAQLAELEQNLSAAVEHLERLGPERQSAQAALEQSLSKTPPVYWSPTRHLVVSFALDGDTSRQGRKAEGKKASNGTFKNGEATFVPGRIAQAAKFDGKRFIEAGNFGAFGFYDKFSAGAWIYPAGKQGGTVLSRMRDVEEGKGYSLTLEDGKIHLRLLVRWLDDAIRVETERTLAPDRWHHVLFTYDGSRFADGIKIYVNGKREKLRVLLDALNQSFKTDEPLRIGSGGGPGSRFHGTIDEVRLYDTVLSADEAEILATSTSISDIAATVPGTRTRGEAKKIRAYFLENSAPASIRQAYRRTVELREEKEDFIDKIPTTMVMQERETPRQTHILIRGAYDRQGEKITPGVPGALSGGFRGPLRNRLDFARWLVDSSNPLAARVAVNRFWQMIFGTGLVKTVDNFGFQGEPPTHPELLDWLATEFVRTGWDVKGLLKTVVTSATYRQSSRLRPELQQRDPENRLLARGARFRMAAEAIRDQALWVSGLLTGKIGGPSVKPYQPAGLWKELSGTMGTKGYEPDIGEDLYRRSLYTYWRRTIPPPSMITFDAANRETCIVRETRTNTPLQALILMNNVTFVEASRVLAERIIAEGGDTPQERIRMAFRVVTARQPTAEETRILVDGFYRHQESYRRDPEAALRLVREGESPRDESIEVSELAAYTTITNLILNLDETVTKE